MAALAAQSKQKTLMRGVLVLVPAALFTKLVGLFYKIPLIHIVGVEGMAYFLAAYHIYSLLFLLSTTGLPSALSLQIARAVAAGESRAVRRIFGVSLCLFLALGLSGTGCLLAFAPVVAERLAMREASAAIIAIAPALFLSAFLGAAKGYFQGHNKMGATALCEVLEAAGKLLFGLFLALFAKSQGAPTPVVAAYAIFGITAGMALSALVLLVLLLVHLCRHAHARGAVILPSRRKVLRELVCVALPMTLSACVIGLVGLLDTALISNRLQAAGYAPNVANAMYSSYGNLAVPLYNLVPSLLSPLTLALMPLLGASALQGDRQGAEQLFSSARRVTLLIGVPASIGLAIFAKPLLQLIYAGQDAAISVAAPLLSILALSVVPSALLTLCGACLQATGHTLVPVLATGAGACVKLLSESVLLTMPPLHILGAPVSTLACTLTVLVIELVALARVFPFPVLRAQEILRPLLSAFAGVLPGLWLYFFLRGRYGEAAWLILPIVPLCMLLVLFLSFRVSAVERHDLLTLPAGERLCLILEKCKLLK